MLITYIYVYKLNNGHYYVGRTAKPHRRYSEHENGKGSAWTRLHGGAVLMECSRRQVADETAADAAETVKTLQLMQRYGWRKVRGGYFCNIDEVLTEKNLRHHGVFDLVASSVSTQDQKRKFPRSLA